MHGSNDDADVAVANVLDRFYRGLFLAANVCVVGACLWALWSEWVNPWHHDHLRSTLLAAVLLAGALAATWQSDRLYELLRRQPAWTLVPTTIAIVALWIDGSQGSDLYIVSLLLLAPIAVGTDARWTLGAAAYLMVGYAVGLFGVNAISWSHLDAIDDVDAQLEHILAYLPVALLFVYPLEKGASYVARSNQIVNDERERLQKRLRRAQLDARARKLEASDVDAPTPPPVVDPHGARATDELSAREVEVSQLVAEGLSNNAIAEKLFLSPRTVQSHIANAMTKTQTDSRTQLAVLMIRDGLVPAVHTPER